MDLVNELGNDLALAFLVERKHQHKIDSREALELIQTVRESLDRIAERPRIGESPAAFKAPRDSTPR
jgi:hypothetical protein